MDTATDRRQRREEQKAEHRRECLDRMDEQNREALHNRRAQREKKLKKDFATQMAGRFFALEVVAVAGFGLAELPNLVRGYTTFARMLGGLLACAALAGVPVLLISAGRFRRHRRGEAELDISRFQLYSRVTLVVVLVLLLCWGLTALIGV